MKDYTLTAAERTLSSALVVISRAASDAETMRDQTLAEDLHELLVHIRRILQGIGGRGQAYRRL